MSANVSITSILLTSFRPCILWPLAQERQAKSRALLAGEAFTLDGLLQSEGRPEEACLGPSLPQTGHPYSDRSACGRTRPRQPPAYPTCGRRARSCAPLKTLS